MARQARKRRPRLPPGVMDIDAPQLSLPDPEAHTPPHHHHTTTTGRALAPEERQLAHELRATWGVRGGRELIRRHGFDNVAEAVELLRHETDVHHPARFLRWLLEIEAEEDTG